VHNDHFKEAETNYNLFYPMAVRSRVIQGICGVRDLEGVIGIMVIQPQQIVQVMHIKWDYTLVVILTLGDVLCRVRGLLIFTL